MDGTKVQTILVVEDDVDLRRMYRTALSFGGYRVIEATDGTHALRVLDEMPPPDVVILDLMLPTLSGLAVHAEIVNNAETKNVPIVIVTGSSLDVDHLGVACVLRKPVAPERLVEAVGRCIRHGAPGFSKG